METNEAPEKIYCTPTEGGFYFTTIKPEPPFVEGVEYARTDAFIEKALKWYCLDCECNDNCKDAKCFFYREYERYLKGEKNAIPPKFSGRILNEDGSTSDNWRYRHFMAKMQDAFIEKACDYLNKTCRKFILTEKDIEDFKNFMKGK